MAHYDISLWKQCIKFTIKNVPWSTKRQEKNSGLMHARTWILLSLHNSQPNFIQIVVSKSKKFRMQSMIQKTISKLWSSQTEEYTSSALELNQMNSKAYRMHTKMWSAVKKSERLINKRMGRKVLTTFEFLSPIFSTGRHQVHRVRALEQEDPHLPDWK